MKISEDIKLTKTTWEGKPIFAVNCTLMMDEEEYRTFMEEYINDVEIELTEKRPKIKARVGGDK